MFWSFVTSFYCDAVSCHKCLGGLQHLPVLASFDLQFKVNERPTNVKSKSWISNENMIYFVNFLHFVKTPGGPSHKKDISLMLSWLQNIGLQY